MNVKLTIQYDGTRYDGWQRQGNTDNTLQGRLEGVLSPIPPRRYRTTSTAIFPRMWRL